MEFWTWSEAFEIGIPEIDEQHYWLVQQTNRLHRALHDAENNLNVGKLLEELMDYTVNHFIVEEEIFGRLGYPNTLEHLQQHSRFCEQIMGLLMRFDSGEEVGAECLDMLKNWLTHHILKADKAYVDFFQEHGIGRERKAG